MTVDRMLRCPKSHNGGEIVISETTDVKSLPSKVLEGGNDERDHGSWKIQ